MNLPDNMRNKPALDLLLAATVALTILSTQLPLGVGGRTLAMVIAAVFVIAVRPDLIERPPAWFAAAAGMLLAISTNVLAAGNHEFLALYFCIATGLVLWRRDPGWRDQWACNGRWLLAGVMVFASAHKLLSPEYRSGEFWGYFLSLGFAGKFVFASGFWDSAVDGFRENRNVLGGHGYLYADGSSARLGQPFPYLRTVALCFTWATIAAEALVAAAFACSRRSILPHCLLLGFVFLLLLIRPEVEFAALLLVLACIASGGRSPSLQIAYGIGIGVCVLLSLALQGVELGVSF